MITGIIAFGGFLIAQKFLIVTTLLIISEWLGMNKKIEANSIYQAVVAQLKALKAKWQPATVEAKEG